jgi:hypothetical protein
MLIDRTQAASHRPPFHFGLAKTLGKIKTSWANALFETSILAGTALIQKPVLVLSLQTTQKAVSVSHFAAQLYVLSRGRND